MRKTQRATVVLAIISGSTSALHGGGASFQGLGTLPPGGGFSGASEVSADGSVVVGQTTSGLGEQAFRWTSSGGMVGLGFLPGGFSFSTAQGVSDDGAVVVGWGLPALPLDTEAFRWTSGGGMVGLGDLPGGDFFSIAFGVSADGSVVVGSSRSASGGEAFRWTSGGGMVGLGALPGVGFSSIAEGVSANGSVVVGISSSASGFEAFRWTSGGGMVGLGDLPGGGFFSGALGVSADGSVIVGNSSSASGAEAFRWTSGGGMVGLGDLPGGDFDSIAFAASADGSVVVGRGNSASGPEPFIWDATNGMRSLRDVLVNDLGLDLTGWTLLSVTDISADGQSIVGVGTSPSRPFEAWLATVPFQGGLVVPLDIEPGDCPNEFKPRLGNSGHKIDIALVGTEDFDVTEVDFFTILLSRADGVGEAILPERVRVKDRATPFDGDPCGCHERKKDGIPDLRMRFFAVEMTFEMELDLLAEGESVELMVTGELLDGTPFAASDCIVIDDPPGRDDDSDSDDDSDDDNSDDDSSDDDSDS